MSKIEQALLKVYQQQRPSKESLAAPASPEPSVTEQKPTTHTTSHAQELFVRAPTVRSSAERPKVAAPTNESLCIADAWTYTESIEVPMMVACVEMTCVSDSRLEPIEPNAKSPVSAESERAESTDTSARYDDVNAVEEDRCESDAEDDSSGERDNAEVAPVEPPMSVERVRPAWEVDRFTIPERSQQILEAVPTELRQVCQRISQRASRERNIVSVDSHLPGEGRTTVAIALAMGLVEAGQSVLVIDADLDQPSLANHLGIAIPESWLSVMDDDQPIDEACVHSLADGFTILPLDPENRPSYQLSALQGLQRLLPRVQQHFDVVLLDNGPGGQSWVALPREQILEVVVVRDMRNTQDLDLQRLLAHLPNRPKPEVRLVNNFVSSQSVALAKIA